MRLDLYDRQAFDRGAPSIIFVLWLLISVIFSSSLPGSRWRRGLLKIFGANIGEGVVIKPRVRIKLPWKLSVSDHTWIGECTWIDNLAEVSIGRHACMSQSVYICTGNHDWGDKYFRLILKPVVIEDYCWLGAFSTLGPGVRAGEGAVLSLGSVASSDLKPWTVYRGNPAVCVTSRCHNKRNTCQNDEIKN